MSKSEFKLFKKTLIKDKTNNNIKSNSINRNYSEDDIP